MKIMTKVQVCHFEGGTDGIWPEVERVESVNVSFLPVSTLLSSFETKI